MVYTFARVGAAVSMRVEDYYVQGRRGWVRLHEKGGKEHEMPTHHNLDRYLEEYISASGIVDDRKGPLFRTTRGRSGLLTANPLLQPDVWRMIRRRASAVGIKTEISCHTFEPLASLRTSRTEASWKSHSRWLHTNLRERQAFTIGATMRSRLMKWSGSESDPSGIWQNSLGEPLSVANRQLSL